MDKVSWKYKSDTISFLAQLWYAYDNTFIQNGGSQCQKDQLVIFPSSYHFSVKKYQNMG